MKTVSESTENSGNSQKKTSKKFIGTKKANRALGVFLRNSYRTHTALSALADRKANIMIRFNSILISILIVFFKSIFEINPATLISGIVFLTTALFSLAFATFAARPHITRLNKDDLDWQATKDNMYFFGSFTELSLADYEKAFDEMAKDPSIIYGNMSRDLYHLGKVLNLKFKYLKWAYDIFLAGLGFTVLAFLFSFFLFNSSG